MKFLSAITYLYSFPTRRSSDLKLSPDAENEAQRLTATVLAEELVATPPDLIGELTQIISQELEWQKRSEEHTSELQSHVNLVCRLLLEKKNHTKPLQKLILVSD